MSPQESSRMNPPLRVAICRRGRQWPAAALQGISLFFLEVPRGSGEPGGFELGEFCWRRLFDSRVSTQSFHELLVALDLSVQLVLEDTVDYFIELRTRRDTQSL